MAIPEMDEQTYKFELKTTWLKSFLDAVHEHEGKISWIRGAYNINYIIIDIEISDTKLLSEFDDFII